MCSAIAGKISSSSEKDSFDLKDIHQEEHLPYSKDEHLKEIVSVGPDGTKRGAEALLSVFARYPRWSKVARLGNLPLVKPILRVGYRLIASNRYLLSRFTRGKWRVY